MSYERGDWVRFCLDGQLVIGEVLIVRLEPYLEPFPANVTMYTANVTLYTTAGRVRADSVVDSRPAPPASRGLR